MLPLIKLKKRELGSRIAFVGPMGVGKTFAANYLVNNYGYEKYNLAGKLKSIAYEMFNVQGKDGTDRLILQGIGSDFRKYDLDVWIKYLLIKIKVAEDTKYPPKIVVDDVRYLNEANLFKKNGFVLIRLHATRETLKGRLDALYPNRPAEAVLHASETEQEGIVTDFTLPCETVDDLVLLDELITRFSTPND